MDSDNSILSPDLQKTAFRWYLTIIGIQLVRPLHSFVQGEKGNFDLSVAMKILDKNASKYPLTQLSKASFSHEFLA
jgi:hypothetical protein